MKSLKVKLFLIVVLAVTILFTLGLFIANIASADRYVTLSGTSIFNTSGDAEVWAHAVTVDAEGNEIEDSADYYYYTMFTFEEDGDTVTYRRNLAYKWFYNLLDGDDYAGEDVEDTDGDSADAPSEEVTGDVAKLGIGYFNMVIGFEEVNFQKFVISFETQQFSMTKAEKTTNYVIFVPAGDEAKVYAIVTDDKELAELKLDELLAAVDTSEYVALDADNIKIELSEAENKLNGEFAVSIYNVNAEGEKVGEAHTDTFTNVGKMYAKYVSSSTKPVTPLTFSAEFKTDEDGKQEEGQTRARMALYEMNGQSFVLNRKANGDKASTSRSIRTIDNADGTVHYEGGQVNDTQPPVLCLDSGISYIKEGSKLTFSYTAVDVLTQSPSTVTGFFMLTNDQVKNGVDADNYQAERLFKTVTSDEDLYIYPHATHYIPQTSDYGTGSNFGEKLNPVAAIKIYLKLTDTASTGGQSTYVFLDWFVEEQYKLHIDGKDYIAVATDEQGATYNYDIENYTYTDKSGKVHENWDALVTEYQEQVDKAAENLRAGSDSFYLPSLEKLISDNATAYQDMTYAIYYMANGSTSSNTGRTSSNLAISLNTAGDYLFTVYAVDSASNSMWYYDGEEVVEFTASEIWDMYDDSEDEDGAYYKLPWFTFTAGISEISVEDPGEQATAYVGTTYTAKAFEIEGISTSATYTLYRFNNELYAADHNGQALSYEGFMEQKKVLFEEHRNYFTNIVAQSALDVNSEEYELFNDYKWNPSSRSFVPQPQDTNAFFLIKCEVTSTQFPTLEAVCEYMGIAASATPKTIVGEDTWLQDNMTSIILLSIAGAALIGIVLLLVIKPKEQGDIDVRFEEETASKKSKRK